LSSLGQDHCCNATLTRNHRSTHQELACPHRIGRYLSQFIEIAPSYLRIARLQPLFVGD